MTAILCIYFTFITVILSATTEFSLNSPTPEYPRTRQISYSFTLKNKKGTRAHNVKFWTYAPVQQTSSQLCRSLKTSHPAELLKDEYGNTIVEFSFDYIAPYAQVIVDVTANMFLSENPVKNEEGNYSYALMSSSFIQTDNQDMTALAQKLKKSDAEQTVSAVYQWIRQHIKTLGYVKGNRGAAYTLSKKQGDCTDQAELFAALCRENDIPTRVMGGYICHVNTVLAPATYHNWAEYNIGNEWFIADPSLDAINNYPSDYIAMSVMVENPETTNPMGTFPRYRVQGKGIKAKMNR